MIIAIVAMVAVGVFVLAVVGSAISGDRLAESWYRNETEKVRRWIGGGIFFALFFSIAAWIFVEILKTVANPATKAMLAPMPTYAFFIGLVVFLVSALTQWGYITEENQESN